MMCPGSNTQTLATFGTTRTNDRTPAAGLHAHEKAVRALAPDH